VRPEEAENRMPDPDLVKTGIAGLDDILPNGIPLGNVILVEGAIGAGKTTMGVEFVYRGASQFDEPGIIVVFEVSPDKIMRDALGLGWDLRKLEELRKLKIVFTTREVLRQELQQADSVLLARSSKDRRSADLHRRRGALGRQQWRPRVAFRLSCAYRGFAT